MAKKDSKTLIIKEMAKSLNSEGIAEFEAWLMQNSKVIESFMDMPKEALIANYAYARYALDELIDSGDMIESLAEEIETLKEEKINLKMQKIRQVKKQKNSIQTKTENFQDDMRDAMRGNPRTRALTIADRILKKYLNIGQRPPYKHTKGNSKSSMMRYIDDYLPSLREEIDACAPVMKFSDLLRGFRKH